MKRKDETYELSKMETTLSVFLVTYNQGIPKVFPHASIATLEKFQKLYPTLFEHKDSWSIAQHRKKLIDWLFANCPTS